MPRPTQPFSFAAPRGWPAGFAALLALMLSALGGIRIGFDRLVGDCSDDERAAIAALSIDAASQSVQTGVVPVAISSAAPGRRGEWRAVAERSLDGLTGESADLAAPSPRLGCARGPRAP